MDKLNIIQTAAVIDVRGRKRGTKVQIACPVCNDVRWVRIDSTRSKSFSGMCLQCHNKFTSGMNESHPMWKGGKHCLKSGYVEVKLQPDDPFYSMARKTGYILEHRVVMARHMGKCLKSNEIVHHKNGKRNDNRIENLELFDRQTEHIPSMIDAAKIKRLENEIEKLKKIINVMGQSASHEEAHKGERWRR